MKNAEIPGGVYLCQVDETISCGACCGLYNVADPSRESLTRLLESRTERLLKIAGDVDAMLRFASEIERRQTPWRPIRSFQHCPFLGLVGPSRSRVGCLLHPSAEGNEGIDYRGISYYGGLACASYFCPTYHLVPARFKQILINVIPDWHLYGMVVTESDWLMAVFEKIEVMIGRPLMPEDFSGRERRSKALGELLDFKSSWPFRRVPERVVHYFFKDGPGRPEVNYETAGVMSSSLDRILKPLETFLVSAEALNAAENALERAFERIRRELE